MALIRKHSKDAIEKKIKLFLENREQAILNRLENAGWEFVKAARSKSSKQGGFGDVTGNLRSSIGFCIVNKGKIIFENYELSKSGTDGKTGIKEAQTFIKKLSKSFNNSFALIVVAGMDYAAAVERKGKDVITGTSLIIEAELKASIDRITK